ncbi:hypothetical protein [Blautia sp. MSJ-19]|uniref:hypothetical protein n=1 Tax=Blautia sp. MSJ-19 TaxID=2841517 RepID=UPI001C0EB6B8|nr:hypothetical protein [Blautia sp. MSJ-19]MBU5482315.1 hypothetical protein [Blautia sp. MSJ-19]
MNRTRVETMMTYEDWCKAHRKTLKKMFRNTASACIQWTITFIWIFGTPIAMIAHWVLVGY